MRRTDAGTGLLMAKCGVGVVDPSTMTCGNRPLSGSRASLARFRWCRRAPRCPVSYVKMRRLPMGES